MVLQHVFVMKDLGHLHHFLGIFVERYLDDIFFQWCQHALDILECTCIHYYKPCVTLVDTKANVSSDGACISDPTAYQRLAR
jgi:hypothetical protein